MLRNHYTRVFKNYIKVFLKSTSYKFCANEKSSQLGFAQQRTVNYSFFFITILFLNRIYSTLRNFAAAASA